MYLSWWLAVYGFVLCYQRVTVLPCRLQSDVNTLPNRVAFAAFQGEAYGRIGSRRFAREIAEFSCQVCLPVYLG